MTTPTKSCCHKEPVAELPEKADPVAEKTVEWPKLADKVARVAFLIISLYYSPYVATAGFLAGAAFGYQNISSYSTSPPAALAACSQAFFEKLAGSEIPDWMAFAIASAQLYIHIMHHPLFSFIAAGMVGISAGSNIKSRLSEDVHLPPTTNPILA